MIAQSPTPASVSPLMIAPFVLLLLSIAIAPFINRRWWEEYYPAVSLSLAVVTILHYCVLTDRAVSMLHTASEYLSFIALIGSLYVVSGGILIRIRGKSTPLTNIFLLTTGGIISNVLGTTGASMILIRPYLRVNRYRLRGFHVIFFIFVVSNIGGALTPVGDPPLFLGYLKEIPFFWVLENAWPVWAMTLGIVLGIFLLLDWASFRAHEASRHTRPAELHEEAEVKGIHNVFFLSLILVSVFIRRPPFVRELIMAIAAAGSYYSTSKEIHRRNDFNFLPVREVAILFFGIFATMVPALDWLEMNAPSLGIKTAGQFYWGTGMLSGVLDNAPTYLNFLSAAAGLFVDDGRVFEIQRLLAAPNTPAAPDILNTVSSLMVNRPDLVAGGAISADTLRTFYLLANHGIYIKAISIAAVFFGAMTYIGNGPNFMVKSIAEQSGGKCPSFFGYIFKFSIPVLLPVFFLVWLLFFRT